MRLPRERGSFGRDDLLDQHLPGYGGFVLCVKVEFDGGDNRIIFRDAGFGFNV